MPDALTPGPGLGGFRVLFAGGAVTRRCRGPAGRGGLGEGLESFHALRRPWSPVLQELLGVGQRQGVHHPALDLGHDFGLKGFDVRQAHEGAGFGGCTINFNCDFHRSSNRLSALGWPSPEGAAGMPAAQHSANASRLQHSF